MKSLLISLICLTGTLLQAEESHPLTVRIDTPNPGYSIQIQRVDQTEAGLNVLAKVIPPPPGGMHAMMIGTAKDTVSLKEKPGKAKVFLLNRTWDWGNETPVANEEAYLKAIGEHTAIAFTSEEK